MGGGGQLPEEVLPSSWTVLVCQIGSGGGREVRKSWGRREEKEGEGCGEEIQSGNGGEGIEGRGGGRSRKNVW